MKTILLLFISALTLSAAPTYEEFFFEKGDTKHKVVIDLTLDQVRVSTFVNGVYTGKVKRLEMGEFNSFTNSLMTNLFTLIKTNTVDSGKQIAEIKKKQENIRKKQAEEFAKLGPIPVYESRIPERAVKKSPPKTVWGIYVGMDRKVAVRTLLAQGFRIDDVSTYNSGNNYSTASGWFRRGNTSLSIDIDNNTDKVTSIFESLN